ncbi:zinc finger MYM-type 1-like [Paramuricea clavata]|uniref:Zinc finger MYM-type 1-like n=1 Tax=Paramuricea clavata TaxID=317549 RepID=A0A7D9E7V4_PARCT|nr:zinc finger MYM-type 1-like [Paramuricea clavata]
MKRVSSATINDIDTSSESESDGSESVEKQREKTKQNPAKKKKYVQKFLASWLTDVQFKDWLEKRGEVPYCKYCQCSLSCAKTALVRHKENKKHRSLCGIKEKSQSITSMLHSQSKPARIEIKICSFIAEKNLPISIVEDLVPFLKNLFPSDEALKEVKLGKQKATNLIRQVLGFYSIQECVTKLKSNKFSLIIDETTDLSTTSQLAILGVFFNEQEFCLEIILIDLVPLPNGTANTIYNTLIGNLKEKGIPMKNIGFCADTCNVMFGIHHSVAQLLVRDYPWIIAIKCSCHLIHLCSSYASKMLPKSVEDLCRNIFSHFNMSSKRTESFKEFQQFVELKELKILRPGTTRWLSMKSCVKRILDQYTALQLYFTGEVVNDPTHTNDAILSGLNNKFIRAYLEFMDFNLGRFVSFNLLFQSEMPQLYQLKPEVEKLIKSICLDFMDVAHVRSTDAFKINPSNEEKQLPLDKVYLGILATSTLHIIREECEKDHPSISLFLSQCKDFLVEAVNQIQDRFGDCQKLDFLSFLSPSIAHNLKIPSLGGLCQKMPLLKEVADLQEVDKEWRDQSLSPNPKLNESLTALEYWKVVFQEKTATGEPAFPNLIKLVKTVLSLPYSNAAVERVFSQLKLIKTDHRASLKRESLLALLTTKMTLLKSNPPQTLRTVTFEPKKEMLTLYRNMKSDADNDQVAELRKDFIKKLNIV